MVADVESAFMELVPRSVVSIDPMALFSFKDDGARSAGLGTARLLGCNSCRNRAQCSVMSVQQLIPIDTS